MKILINDLMQFSDLPDDLKSPGLDTQYPNSGPISVSFSIPSAYAQYNIVPGVLAQPFYNSVTYAAFIDGVLSQPLSYNSGSIDGVLSQPLSVSGANEFTCIGIGGTDATRVIINGSIIIASTDGGSLKTGLYELGETLTASNVTIEHNGTYMGRIAAGMCMKLGISNTRESGLFTNVNSRRSFSGAVVPAAGGYGGRVIGVDFRYKIDRDIYTEIERAYVTQIMAGFPFFIDFENDAWLPINKFYGSTDGNLLFQSSINGFKYSKRFEFREAF